MLFIIGNFFVVFKKKNQFSYNLCVIKNARVLKSRQINQYHEHFLTVSDITNKKDLFCQTLFYETLPLNEARKILTNRITEKMQQNKEIGVNNLTI